MLSMNKADIPNHLLKFFRPKSVCRKGEMINTPAMFAEAMRADGWLLRSELTWVKLSSMPESVAGWRWERCRVKVATRVRGKEKWSANACQSPQGDHRLGVIDGRQEWTDCPGCKKCIPNGGLVLRKGSWRPTRATESIFLFAKTDKYFCDGEAVKQHARDSTVMRDRYTRIIDDPDEQFAVAHDHETESGGTANLRNWVLFKGEPLREGHYAAYPSGLPRLAIKAGTSEKGVCSHCGAPWARIVDRKNMEVCKSDRAKMEGMEISTSGTMISPPECLTVGWRPTCICPVHDPVPATVLDPFLGSGTTLCVCARSNRKGIGIELNEEYVGIAAKRIRKAFRKKGFGLI